MKIRKRVRPADFGQPSQDAAVAVESAGDAATPAVRSETPPVRYQDVDTFEGPPAWHIYLIALAVSVLWALAPIAFALGYRKAVAPLQNDQFAMMVFALLAIGPAVLVWGAAYMIRQGQKLGAEAKRAKSTADAMLAPAMIAAAQAGDVVHQVRSEIERASAATIDAHETLMSLREALAQETDRLTQATAQSAQTASDLTASLGRERAEMTALSATLDAQSAKVSEAITQQARMVAEASDLAETQLREAEATLTARAADLAAAAGEAGDMARTAGEDLTRNIARLETAGLGVAEQVRAVEGGLTDQRTALVTLAHALRSDHGAFSNEADAHAAKLSEFITQTRLSAMEMNDRAIKGGESLRELMADAAEQFRDLAETAKAEREEFGQSTLQSLDAVSAAAAEQRAQLEAQTRSAIEALSAAAEETRAAAGRHASAAREQVDHLSEAAFAAGQKANQVFEARLAEARALVEQSGQMVEAAGAATARKLDEGATAARATLEELKSMMTEIDQRAAGLPTAALGQVQQVRAAVTQGMDELMAQARRTAEEAHAIDTAFQERVRRNFDMLSEAVRLMGAVAGAPPPEPVALSRPARRPPPPAPEVALEPVAPVAPVAVAAEPVEDEPPLDLDQVASSPSALELGLRTRLKLTPTATDQEISSIFVGGAASPRSATPAARAEVDADEAELEGEAWTWKDLLASLDGADGEGERLEDILSTELSRMGVEPAKLLPKARIEEIAAAVQTGDLDGARAVVKKLAPAATRRIARRLFTDEQVRRQVEVYVRRYQTLVDDAMVRDPEGLLMEGLLGGDAGRLYLLLDAAAGDMA